MNKRVVNNKLSDKGSPVFTFSLPEGVASPPALPSVMPLIVQLHAPTPFAQIGRGYL